MNIPKNFEAVFLAAAVVATFASYAIAAEPARHAGAPLAASAAGANSAMQVIVIHGQRLNAAQKAEVR
ncbi:MAG: hypothetical protein H7176_13160 [Bdellovibrionales bacterium]|nr:hypothetical protein [Massilia sp.]